MAHLLHHFDYDLPDSLVAQQPLPTRDQSRLMLLRRGQAAVAHHAFRELPRLLPPRSLLVLNNTRVLPRRLKGRLPGGSAVEALLLDDLGEGRWSAMVRRARRVKPGMTLDFAGGRLPATAISRTEEGHWILHFPQGEALPALLKTHGLAPLPPYIRREEDSAACQAKLDREAYQTCYASVEGAIAAPTAGLHFVPGVLDEVRARGHSVVVLTLHVGLGTFSPVKTERIEFHKMHREWYDIPGAAVSEIRAARAAGRPVIAVGTTAVRALESWAAEGFPDTLQGWTELFIRPPYPFQVVNGMVTNFHQPRSTLLMLVSAFHGREELLAAYGEAVAEQYRFFSYGDCMAILPGAG